jgi:hypothetical protein
MMKRSNVLWAFSQSSVLLLVIACTTVSAQTKQEHVHNMGQMVMPFDLSKTTHIFRMTETGGVEGVVVKDESEADQISLIQQHLQHEAQAFQRGDYGDPASLHGATMPGLREVVAGAAMIKVTYTALPAGAEITFETSDIHILTAIHRWFGAQLSEHGADARAE